MVSCSLSGHKEVTYRASGYHIIHPFSLTCVVSFHRFPVLMTFKKYEKQKTRQVKKLLRILAYNTCLKRFLHCFFVLVQRNILSSRLHVNKQNFNFNKMYINLKYITANFPTKGISSKR